jgi:HAD superfamily hydrolase (TIGR01509 family)
MPLQALLLDLDGTLIDTEEAHRRAFNQTFVDFGLGWDWTPEVYAGLLSVSGGLDRIAAYVQSLDVPAERRRQLNALVPLIHREKTRHYGANASRSPRPGAVRLMREAMNVGIQIGVVASSDAANVQDIIVSTFGQELHAAMGAVVTGSLTDRRKPAPDIYRLLISMLDVDVGDCIAIEDSANGVAAASNAGLYTIATPSRWTAGQDFSKANLVLSGLGDPAAPLPDSDAEKLGGSVTLGIAEIECVLKCAIDVRPGRRVM